jgi:hypothetical protein
MQSEVRDFAEAVSVDSTWSADIAPYVGHGVADHDRKLRRREADLAAPGRQSSPDPSRVQGSGPSSKGRPSGKRRQGVYVRWDESQQPSNKRLKCGRFAEKSILFSGFARNLPYGLWSMAPTPIYNLQELSDLVDKPVKWLRRKIDAGLLACHQDAPGATIHVTLKQYNDYLDRTYVLKEQPLKDAPAVRRRHRGTTRSAGRAMNRRNPASYKPSSF